MTLILSSDGGSFDTFNFKTNPTRFFTARAIPRVSLFHFERQIKQWILSFLDNIIKCLWCWSGNAKNLNNINNMILFFCGMLIKLVQILCRYLLLLYTFRMLDNVVVTNIFSTLYRAWMLMWTFPANRQS